MEGILTDVDEGQFNEILASTDKPVVVEFYTVTCPVCAAMEPTLIQLAEEMKDEAIFIKVNVQTNRELAAFHGIMGVPTLYFYCEQKVVHATTGEVNSTVLRNTIKDMIKHARECKTRPKVYEMDGYG